MEEEKHLNPLAKMEEEIPSKKTLNGAISRHKKSSSKWLVYILITIVLLSIAVLLIGLILLRVDAPTLRLSNVVVKDLHYQSASLNSTVIAQIRLHNMNFGRFSFHGGNAIFLYRNATIGAAKIYDGGVGRRERIEVNATIVVMMAGFSEREMNLSRDIGLGLVRVRSFAELRGEVRVVKMVNRPTTAVMNCTMDFNLTSQAIIQGLSCL